MGQRSQVYFRYNAPDGKYFLIAHYYQWMYGTRMVSRARGIIEWLQQYKSATQYFAADMSNEYMHKLNMIIDTNFDLRDVTVSQDILEEYTRGYWDSPEEIFLGQDNNDGQLLIDLIVDWSKEDKHWNHPCKIKYAFLNCSSELIGNGEAYMNWEQECLVDTWQNCYPKEVKLTERNIRYIDKHAKLMTPEEIYEYIHHDYVSDMGIKVEEEVM